MTPLPMSVNLRTVWVLTLAPKRLLYIRTEWQMIKHAYGTYVHLLVVYFTFVLASDSVQHTLQRHSLRQKLVPGTENRERGQPGEPT